MARPIRFLLSFASIGLMFLSGCGKSPEPVVSPEPDLPIADPVVEPKTVPITGPTEADARQFAKDLEAAFEARDQKGMDALIRYFDLLESVLSGLPENEREGILFETKLIHAQRDMASIILRRTEDGGSYKYLRLYQAQGRVQALFRLIDSDGGVTYHNYVLGRRANGSIGPIDIYIPEAGEFASQSIHRMALPIIVQVSEKGLEGLDADSRKSIPQIGLMTRANAEGRFKDVIAIYRQLPANLKEEKVIMLAYVSALINSDVLGEESFAAVELFREKFPGDISLDFVELHRSVAKKQHVKALASIDRIDMMVGGDPYLNVLRANSQMELKRYEDAKNSLTIGLEAEPDLENLYEARLSLSLRTKKFDETLEWLKRTVEVCKTPIGDLTKAPEYADFVKSPQHVLWLEWKGTDKKD